MFARVEIKLLQNKRMQPYSISTLGILYVLLSAVTFAAKAIFIKHAYSEFQIDPMTLLTLRLMMTIFILGAITPFMRPQVPQGIARKDYITVLMLGVIGFYVSAYLDFVGLQYISASLERVIIFIYPTLVVLLTAFLARKKISSNQLLALAVTYTGLVVAFVGELSFQQKDLFKGGFLVFISAFTYASYVYGSASLIKIFGSWFFTVFALGGATAASITAQLLCSNESFLDQPFGIYKLSFWMALVSTVLPTIFLAEGIKAIGSANASIVATAGPIFTILLAWFFLAEPVHMPQLLGAIFVIAGVLLLNRKKTFIKAD